MEEAPTLLLVAAVLLIPLAFGVARHLFVRWEQRQQHNEHASRWHLKAAVDPGVSRNFLHPRKVGRDNVKLPRRRGRFRRI